MANQGGNSGSSSLRSPEALRASAHAGDDPGRVGLLEAIAREICNVHYGPSADVIKEDREGAERILFAIGMWVGQRALRYDREADAAKDGVRKAQGATLAVLANELTGALNFRATPLMVTETNQ